MTIAIDQFRSLAAPQSEQGLATYTVAALEGLAQSYVAKSSEGLPAFIVGAEGRRSPRAPVILRNLTVTFGVECDLRMRGASQRVNATVAACRSDDPELQRYFLWAGEAALRNADLAAQPDLAMDRLAELFQRLGAPRNREAQGLFGELLLIARAPNCAWLAQGWRSRSSEHFDFSWDGLRLEVKTSARRSRRHNFSAAQCSPAGPAVVASMFVERLTGGTTIADLVDRIARQIDESGLLGKVQMLVATALGQDAIRELDYGFDEDLALESLLFFDLNSIPGLRSPFPEGVGDVRFTSDVSLGPPLGGELIDAFAPRVSL